MPAKKRIEENRNRYRTCAFRMSDAEWVELNQRVLLSGRKRQEFLIEGVLHQKVTVIGNEVLFKRMDEKLDAVLTELKRINRACAIDSELLPPVRMIVEMLEGFQVRDSL